jgi:hypothetical protein
MDEDPRVDGELRRPDDAIRPPCAPATPTTRSGAGAETPPASWATARRPAAASPAKPLSSGRDRAGRLPSSPERRDSRRATTECRSARLAWGKRSPAHSYTSRSEIPSWERATRPLCQSPDTCTHDPRLSTKAGQDQRWSRLRGKAFQVRADVVDGDGPFRRSGQLCLEFGPLASEVKLLRLEVAHARPQASLVQYGRHRPPPGRRLYKHARRRPL